MSDASNWRVYGKIVGERLPTRNVQIGHMWVGTSPPNLGWFEHFHRPNIDDPKPFSCIFEYADLVVHSSIHFWTDIPANSPKEAMDAVEHTDLPLLQTALSLMSVKQSYRVRILGAQDIGGNVSAPSPIGYLPFGDTLPGLPDDEIAHAFEYFELLSKSEMATTASRHLTDAVRLRDLSWTPKDFESTLLSAFKVIECLAGKTQQAPAQDLDDSRQVVVDELLGELQAHPRLEDAAKAIRQARDKLARIDVAFLGQKITAMAEALGLDDEWRTAALKFNKFRNERLGHSVAATTEAERKPWLEQGSETSAWALGRKLLVFYANHQRRIENVHRTSGS